MNPASVQQDLYLQEGSVTKISHPSADTMSEVGAASVVTLCLKKVAHSVIVII